LDWWTEQYRSERDHSMTRTLFLVFVAAVCTAAAAGFPPPKPAVYQNHNKLAKEAAETFAYNLLRADVDAVLESVEFPVLEAHRTYATAEALREDMGKVGKAEFATRKIVVKEVIAPDKISDWAKVLTDPPKMMAEGDKLKTLSERIGKGGRIVAVELKFGESEARPGLVWFLFKDGKPLIVGISD
jgi:hypothetical protein